MLEILAYNLYKIYDEISGIVPDKYKPLVVLAFFTLVLVIFSIFTWKFCKFMAKKDIIELNLSKYNRTKHPFLNKLFASFLFFLEYIIILPVIVFFWFSVLSIMLLLISESSNVNQIFMFSAATVVATRVSAYYSEELADIMAQLFPFTALVIFLLEPGVFNVKMMLDRFLAIPSSFNNILIFFVFIIAVEIFLRGLFTVIDLFSSNEE